MGKIKRERLAERLSDAVTEAGQNRIRKSIENAMEKITIKNPELGSNDLRGELDSWARCYTAWLGFPTLETAAESKEALDQMVSAIDYTIASIKVITGESNHKYMGATCYILGWCWPIPGKTHGQSTEWISCLEEMKAKAKYASNFIEEQGLNKVGAGNFGEALRGSPLEDLKKFCRDSFQRRGCSDEARVLEIVQAIDKAVTGGDLRQPFNPSPRSTKSQLGRVKQRRPKSD
jgi:hypothetical protein